MFENDPPVCVLYWKVTGDCPVKVILFGFNSLVTQPIPLPQRVPADTFILRFTPFGDGTIPWFMNLSGVHKSLNDDIGETS